MKNIALSLIAVLVLAAASFAAEPIALPEPVKAGGPALLDMLAARRAGRNFDPEAVLTDQELSNLLWATGGVSDPASGKMTYPTGLDMRDISIYAVTAKGVFRYDNAANTLVPVADGDHRAETGKQPYVADAAVNLVFVTDKRAWAAKNVPFTPQTAGIHAGGAGQNAALYAASQGWAAVERTSFDWKKVSSLLKLDENYVGLLTESIGPHK